MDIAETGGARSRLRTAARTNAITAEASYKTDDREQRTHQMPGTGRTDNAISGHTMPTAAKIASSPTPADDAHGLVDAIERQMDGPKLVSRRRHAVFSIVEACFGSLGTIQVGLFGHASFVAHLMVVGSTAARRRSRTSPDSSASSWWRPRSSP